jgi:hypothetical protein
MREYQFMITPGRKTRVFIEFAIKKLVITPADKCINFLSTRSIMQEHSTVQSDAKEHIVHFLIDKR